METMVHFDVKKENDAYFIYMLDHRIGKGFRDKKVADVIVKWFMGASQDLIDAYSAIVDKAFKEREK